MANWIHDIEIKNFKSIRHQRIEDCRRVNVFVGYPNVGKSNILEALSLFSINDQTLDFSAFVRIKNLTTFFHNGNVQEQSEVRIGDKHRVIAHLVNDELVLQHEFEREGSSFEKKDSGIYYSDDSHHVLVRRHFRVRENEKAIIDFGSSIIGRENELPDIKKYEFNKRIVHSSKGYTSLLSPFGENIFNIISTNSALRQEVVELFKPNKLELVYDSRIQEFAILKRTENGIFSLPYELVADTLQRLVFYQSAVLSNKDAVLIFEEPEAHMFPPYVSKFTAEVMHDEGQNQYFIATHSPFVLNDFMEDLEDDELSIYAVGYKNETGETIVRRLADDEITEIYQYGIDLFFNLENYLKDAV